MIWIYLAPPTAMLAGFVIGLNWEKLRNKKPLMPHEVQSKAMKEALDFMYKGINPITNGE
jgi:hypothetical protein